MTLAESMSLSAGITTTIMKSADILLLGTALQIARVQMLLQA